MDTVNFSCVVFSTNVYEHVIQLKKRKKEEKKKKKKSEPGMVASVLKQGTGKQHSSSKMQATNNGMHLMLYRVSPFTCCLSVVLYLDKGVTPKIRLFCFVTNE